MICGDSVAEGVSCEMGVDFRGGDAFVTKHFLYGTEVGAVLHKLSRKTVT